MEKTNLCKFIKTVKSVRDTMNNMFNDIFRQSLLEYQKETNSNEVFISSDFYCDYCNDDGFNEVVRITSFTFNDEYEVNKYTIITDFSEEIECNDVNIILSSEERLELADIVVNQLVGCVD